MSEALAVVTGGGAVQTMEHVPTVVLAEAQKAAAALKDVIGRKPKPVIMNGEQYLEFEDWQTCARFYAITVGIEAEPEFVDLGGVQGFKATAVALRNGQVISRASAYCMRDEEKWGSRPKYEWRDGQRIQIGSEPVPTFQLASMAQTRACAKALRNVLSWVAVLAGYRPTPAEEMDGVAHRAPARTTGDKPACPECKSNEQVIVGKYPDKRTGVKKPWYCLRHKISWGNSEQPSGAPAGSQDPDGGGEPWMADGPQE